ncbi:hypothetical protein LSH36_197g01023 [Paralvinella palmiformis]|uniref:Transmembrane protein 192 n=1 Tax=Paralvinella palmiformis TaxID=53620 RepID=A0AAD9JPP7_9ANNE|nr:hypothetical protein LSH36_197g01023 [Paralvinella palmiformis]
MSMADNQIQGNSNLTGRQITSGFPFDEWSQSVQDTDQLVSIREQQQERAFQPMTTPLSIILLILIMVCFEIAVFLVPHLSHPDSFIIPPYSILMYTQSSLWFFLMLIDRYWRFEHYISRTKGYLEFYRYTRHLRRMPIMIISGGKYKAYEHRTVLLLILTTLLSVNCHTEPGHECPGIPLTRCQYAQIVISVQVAIVLPILIIYLIRTIKFNKAASVPDIQEEDTFSSITTSRTLCNGVGFRDDSYVDDILEKQADMIRYLKHHNNHLGRKVLQLTAQLEHEHS